MIILLIIITGLLIAVLLTKAVLFRPLDEAPVPDAEPSPFKEKEVAKHLAEMIKLPTVSSRNPEAVNSKAFTDFRKLLTKLYPLTTACCKLKNVGESGILYHWKGVSSEKPVVLMAHYDVVPADESDWQHPPFSGKIDKDGNIWGRGAIDTKVTVCGILEAVEAALKKKYVPANDIWISFSGDEETMGASAPAAVDYLESIGVTPALVIDEGGAVISGIFPGVKEPCAVIGISEKGVLDVEFSVKSDGGHASAPPAAQTVTVLAEAIRRIHSRPFPARLTSASKALFDTLGRRSSFGLRLIFANLRLFLPLLKKICTIAGGELNALMRTTCAFTILEGSSAYNVMPSEARAGANLRLLQGDTVESAMKRLRRSVKNPRVEIKKVWGHDPSTESAPVGEMWDIVSTTVKQTWPGVIVSPYPMVACTDSRHFGRISRSVYRFSALELTKEERGMIHGRNERIPASKAATACAFFYRLIRKL